MLKIYGQSKNSWNRWNDDKMQVTEKRGQVAPRMGVRTHVDKAWTTFANGRIKGPGAKSVVFPLLQNSNDMANFSILLHKILIKDSRTISSKSRLKFWNTILLEIPKI